MSHNGVDRAAVGPYLDAPLDPGSWAGPDDVALSLAALRTRAGTPSFTRVTQRVARVRSARGVPSAEASAGRVTVYDCFRAGRRRLDPDLVLDIARALGLGDAGVVAWRVGLGRVAVARPDLSDVRATTALPRVPTPFVGRDDDVAAIVASESRAVLIDGMSGIGKTTLALSAATDLLRGGRYHRVCFVELGGPRGDASGLDGATLAGGILAALGDPGAQSASLSGRERLERYHAMMRDEPVLVVLDDLSTPEQLEQLTPTRSRGRLVATSRTRFDTGPETEVIHLEGLEADAASELVGAVAGRTFLPGEHQTLRRLCDRTGRHPFALTLLGSRIGRLPDWSLTDHHEAESRRDTVKALDDTIEESLALAYEALTPAAQQTLRRICDLPQLDHGTPVLAALLDETEPTTLDLLRTLCDAHMLRSPGVGRWQVHDLVRTFGHRRSIDLDRPAAVTAARRRVQSYYVDETTSAIAVSYPMTVFDWDWVSADEIPPRDEAEAREWLDRERSNLVACASWALELGDHDTVMRLAASLPHYLQTGGATDATLALQQAGRSAANQAGSDRDRALAERNVGTTLARRAEYGLAETHLQNALSIYSRLGHDGGATASLNALAVVASATGDQDLAVERMEQVLEHCARSPDNERYPITLTNLGVVHARAGRLDQSLPYLEQAAEVSRQYHWPAREQWALSSLSDVYAMQSHGTAAHDAAVRAHDLAVLLHDEVGVAYAQSNTAVALHLLGETSRAYELATSTLERSRTLEDPELTASVLNHLGDFHRADRQAAEAGSRYEQALAVAEEIGEANEIQRARDGLAAIGSVSR